MRKRKKVIGKRMISLLLILALFVTAVDITAFATGTEESEREEASAQEEMQEEELSSEKEQEILSEVESERTEESKTFRMSDGSFQVAWYGTPVHYQDAEGEWKEIDTSMEEQGDSYATKKTDGRKERVAFSKKYKEGKAVSVKNSEYPVSWGLEDPNKAEIKVMETEAGKKKGNERFLVLDGLSQTVLYEEVYEGVDVEYTVRSEGIKENIILQHEGAGNVFDTVWDIGKLEPVQKDERIISLMDGETEIYYIQAPYMVDAYGEQSEALAMSFTVTGNKEITVHLTADSEWLEAQDRAYPVIVDPYVLTETTKADIDTTFVTSGMAGTNHSEKLELLVGKESSSYGKCRTLVKIVMPELQAGDMVVDAKLRLYLYQSDFYSSTTPELQVNAYRITEDWDPSKVTWNTQPGHNSTVLDFAYINRQSITDYAEPKFFDITRAVKEWYEGSSENYGIMLCSANESGSYAEAGVKGYFWPERYNDVSDAYPLIQITYRNNKGLEDYWTYTDVGAGSAGTAYINDYTGNPVLVHEDVSTTGELLPVSLKHVYNGYMLKTKYKSNYPVTGRGFRLSFQQTLKSSSVYGLSGSALTDFPYAYEDEDGTVHFFYKKTEGGKIRYLDEDGLNLELTISGSVKTITDKEDNKMVFDSNGNLSYIQDASGNRITVSYTTADNGKQTIESITDGAGHKIMLAMDAEHQLQKITDPEGREIQFFYSTAADTVENGSAPGAGYLVRIQYPDGNSSHYAYDKDGALVKMTSKDGSSIRLEYTTVQKGKRVKKAAEYGTDGSAGQAVAFSRVYMNTTIIRTNGTDDTYGTDDDLRTFLTFDDYGRTRGAYTRTADEEGLEYGSSFYEYSGGSGDVTGSISSLNRITSEAYSSPNIRNYLEDHSGEYGGVWNDYAWRVSSVEHTAQRSTVHSMFGKYALELGIETAPAVGGASYRQVLSLDEVVPGGTYTLSGYIRTADVVQGNETGIPYGACVGFLIIKDDGTVEREYSEFLSGTSEEGEEGWERVSVTAQIPEDTATLRACLILDNAEGKAWFDGIQLEEGESANPYNLLENAGFEDSEDGILPDYWGTQNSSTSDGLRTSAIAERGRIVRLFGEGNTQKRLYQRVPVGGKESDIYVASCWSNANAVDDTDGRNSSYKIYANVFYSDGTSCLKEQNAHFNRDYTSWQKATFAFDLSDGTDAEKIPEKVTFCLCYYNQANPVYFDSAQMVRDIWGIYTYDKEGNLITTAENAEQTTAFGYDEDNNLTSVRDAKNNLYEYTYDDAHRVTEAAAPEGQKIGFTYNNEGNVTETVISNTAGSRKLRSLQEYTLEEGGIAEGAYVQKETDQDGKETSYEWDLQSGRLQSVTTPDQTVTSYTYKEGTDLLTSVSAGGASVSYDYSNADTRLAKITHNGMEYTFTYDVFGNVTAVAAGESVLNTNTYAAGNGKLLRNEYGNGDRLEYTYDRAGNVVSVLRNGAESHAWNYDASQVMTAYQDKENGREHSYDYDITGRLMKVWVKDVQSGENQFTSAYDYDSLNAIEKETVTAGGHSQKTQYAYNKNGQPLTVDYSGDIVNMNYDDLGRLVSKSVSTEELLEYNYTYMDSSQNAEGEELYQTVLLETESIGDTVYRYTYDSRGNILDIYEREGEDEERLLVSYSYDALGQLVREDNALQVCTIFYSYDGGGNLIERKEYAYTTEADLAESTVQKTVVYGYDSSWKDKMVAYDGTGITYDAIGNPITYRGKAMEWEGRQLESLTEEGVQASYGYDADGIRVRKTVNGTESRYYYSGGQLSYEKRGNREFFYIYDSYGTLAAIRYYDSTGSMRLYHAGVNSRGDVEYLYNEAGEVAARYRYDTWGRVLSVTDGQGEEVTDAGHIGLLNPIRYRGYYYDVETGFYYVSSRYYDPEVGRFISADTIDILGADSDLYDKNLYAYCDNNPVVRADSDGTLWYMAIGAALGGVISGGLEVLSQAQAGGSYDISKIIIATASGAAGGAFAATSYKVGIQIAVNAAIGIGSYLADSVMHNESITLGGVVSNGLAGAASGAIGWHGANGKMLQNSWKVANKTIAKETRRNSYKYSAKRIAQKKIVKSGIKKTTGVATARFTVGTLVSRTVSSIGKSFSKLWKKLWK